MRASSVSIRFGLELVVLMPGQRLERVAWTVPHSDPTYPSLTHLLPALAWDEREAKDLFGIMPSGHPDPRRLVLHDTWPRGYHPLRKDISATERPPLEERHFDAFSVQGEDVYELPVGPIHAGVIEPGHFRFSAVGETVLHLDARLFYTHRGVEKLAEGRTFAAAAFLLERACMVCGVAHASAYADAIERLTETSVPPEVAWTRLLLLELERLYNHVSDLGNMCAGVGFHFGTSQFAWLKERLLRINEQISGHRYLAGVIVPGGLRVPLEPAGLRVLADALPELEHEIAALVRHLNRSSSLSDRFRGTGIVPVELARAMGATGVAARASGVDVDLRRDLRSGAYLETDVHVASATTGDVAARFHVRSQEVHESIRLLSLAIDRVDDKVWQVPLGRPAEAGATALGWVEGPRGASWLWLRAGAEGVSDRVHLRSASFANWPTVAAAVPGNLVPDFPLINKSFELCYACTDR